MLAADLPLAQPDSPPANLIAAGPSREECVEIHITALQKAMWKCAGLLRDEATLREGMRELEKCQSNIDEMVQQGTTSRRLSEAQALCRVAGAILRSAQARTESRGAHFRSDYPRRNDEQFRKHSIVGRKGAEAKGAEPKDTERKDTEPVVFEEW
jgi:succinate dehydrogenase/fumarate reductase flavoprotein subunit